MSLVQHSAFTFPMRVVELAHLRVTVDALVCLFLNRTVRADDSGKRTVQKDPTQLANPVLLQPLHDRSQVVQQLKP